MPRVCVDASCMVAWLVPGPRYPAMETAWNAFVRGEDQFIGPPLLYVETISVIRRLAYRGLLGHDEAVGLVRDFLALEIPTPVPAGVHEETFVLATRLGQSKAYDACYLATAYLLSCPFFTLDERLYNTATDKFPFVKLLSR
ncbi:MAG: type II toxin-antitoxin system VapC family toxin [Chloroflexi bacterium]|nr:type II toxin-antitoxin system VapC family toxin [Chloroflexota bacterium]